MRRSLLMMQQEFRNIQGLINDKDQEIQLLKQGIIQKCSNSLDAEAQTDACPAEGMIKIDGVGVGDRVLFLPVPDQAGCYVGLDLMMPPDQADDTESLLSSQTTSSTKIKKLQKQADLWLDISTQPKRL